MSSKSSDDIEDTVMLRVGDGIFWMEWLTNLTIYNDDANGLYLLTKLKPSSYISTFCIIIVCTLKYNEQTLNGH